MEPPANIDFDAIAQSSKTLELLPLNIVTLLMSDLSKGAPATYNGRVYQNGEVREMFKRLQSGEKVTKIPQHRGDFLMAQGVVVQPTYIEEKEEIIYPVVPLDDAVKPNFERIPVTSALPNLFDCVAGQKRYYLDLDIKEDIKLFATLYSYVGHKDTGSSDWEANVLPSTFWSRKGIQIGATPYAALKYITPPKVMSGQTLMEYLYTTKSLWPLVQTVVEMAITDIQIPLLDEDGEQQVDPESGDLIMTYANSQVKFSLPGGTQVYRRAQRDRRVPPILYNTATEKYQASIALEAFKNEVKIGNYLECNTDYYDGIDYSKNLNDIRMKVACLEALDLDPLPNTIGVVTGQQEEFNVVERFFNEKYKAKKLIKLTSNSAQNFDGFKMFMKPISMVDTIQIHDKTRVNRAQILDAGIHSAVIRGEYPRGFGFMTNLLIAHHKPGTEATSAKAPGEELDHIPLPEDYAFKQLHSEAPLQFFPYIHWKSELVGSIEGRETVSPPLKNLNTHLWLLLNYPYSAYTYCEHAAQNSPPIIWTKGKTAMDVMFELDADFKKGGVSQYREEKKNYHVLPKKVIDTAKPLPSAPPLEEPKVRSRGKEREKAPIIREPPPEKKPPVSAPPARKPKPQALRIKRVQEPEEVEDVEIATYDYGEDEQ